MAENKKTPAAAPEEISARLKAATGSIDQLNSDARSRKNGQKKAASAKAVQDKKKAAGDPIADAVLAALTDKPTRIADIVIATGSDAITAGMCVNRLTKLVNAGVAIKTTITVAVDGGKSRKATAYALAPADGE